MNQDYLPVLLALLSKARKTIDVISYSFAIGSAAGVHATRGAPYEVARALRELKRRHGKKLRIRLFTEGLRETSDRNKVTAAFLADAGVEVRFGSTHAKGFCVDGRYVLFGSTNLTNQSIMKNNEANLLLDDEEVARQFRKYFDHLWKGGGHGGVELAPPLLADGGFKDAIIDMLGRAKRRIEFSIYFFNHREIERALVEAHERGVAVTGFVHQHATFAYPYVRANRATVRRLRGAGLADLHLSVPTTFSHSKYLVVDRREVALGTGNWLVEDVVTHPQLYIHLRSAPVARALVRHLSYQLETQATRD